MIIIIILTVIIIVPVVLIVIHAVAIAPQTHAPWADFESHSEGFATNSKATSQERCHASSHCVSPMVAHAREQHSLHEVLPRHSARHGRFRL